MFELVLIALLVVAFVGAGPAGERRAKRRLATTENAGQNLIGKAKSAVPS